MNNDQVDYLLWARARNPQTPSEWKFQDRYDRSIIAVSAGFKLQAKYPEQEFQVICSDQRMIHHAEAWDGME